MEPSRATGGCGSNLAERGGIGVPRPGRFPAAFRGKLGLRESLGAKRPRKGRKERGNSPETGCEQLDTVADGAHESRNRPRFDAPRLVRESFTSPKDEPAACDSTRPVLNTRPLYGRSLMSVLSVVQRDEGVNGTAKRPARKPRPASKPRVSRASMKHARRLAAPSAPSASGCWAYPSRTVRSPSAS